MMPFNPYYLKYKDYHKECWQLGNRYTDIAEISYVDSKSREESNELTEAEKFVCKLIISVIGLFSLMVFLIFYCF